MSMGRPLPTMQQNSTVSRLCQACLSWCQEHWMLKIKLAIRLPTTPFVPEDNMAALRCMHELTPEALKATDQFGDTPADVAHLLIWNVLICPAQ